MALLATRQDRPLRTKAFMAWLAEEAAFSRILPVGGHAPYARFRIPEDRRLALPPRLALPWPGPEPRALLAALDHRLGPCLVVGLGNARGFGERFRAWAEGASC